MFHQLKEGDRVRYQRDPRIDKRKLHGFVKKVGKHGVIIRVEFDDGVVRVCDPKWLARE